MHSTPTLFIPEFPPNYIPIALMWFTPKSPTNSNPVMPPTPKDLISRTPKNPSNPKAFQLFFVPPIRNHTLYML